MIRTIDTLTRLNNSAMGNPRYRVTFTDGSEYVTSSDHSFVYAINNPEYRTVPLRVTLTRSGRISDLTPTVAPIPDDFPVRPIPAGSEGSDVAMCGTCHLFWDDAIVTPWTPAPSGRCPFEAFHDPTG